MEHKHDTKQYTNSEIPTPELRYYKLTELERTHYQQQKEVLQLIQEIEENVHKTNEELIKHDLRIKQLEADKETQNKYLYGIIIMILTQICTQILQFIPK